MAFFELESGQMYYKSVGRGECMVMLRGLGRSSAYWLGYERRFQDQYRVITFDHRGLGQTTAPMTWTHSIEDLADDVLKLLDHLKIEKAHFFGLSLGGMIAMAIAKRYPERCLSLMVANSSTADYLGFRLNPVVAKELLLAWRQDDFQERLLRLVTTKTIFRRHGENLMSAWQLILNKEGFPVQAIVKQILAASRFRIGRKINGRTLPTLILSGENDQLVPPRNSRKIASIIRDAKFQSVRGVGHEITIGREEAVEMLLRGFMENVGKKAQSATKTEKKRPKQSSSIKSKNASTVAKTASSAGKSTKKPASAGSGSKKASVGKIKGRQNSVRSTSTP